MMPNNLKAKTPKDLQIKKHNHVYFKSLQNFFGHFILGMEILPNSLENTPNIRFLTVNYKY